MNDGPKITTLPNAEEVRKLVEAIIVPGDADRQAKALIELLMCSANAECEQQYDIAETASRHAFAMTDAFEESFRKFAGWPAEGYSTDAQSIQVLGGKAS